MAFKKIEIQCGVKGAAVRYRIQTFAEGKNKSLILLIRGDVAKRCSFKEGDHLDFFQGSGEDKGKVAVIADADGTRTFAKSGKSLKVTAPYRDEIADLFPDRDAITELKVAEEEPQRLVLVQPK